MNEFSELEQLALAATEGPIMMEMDPRDVLAFLRKRFPKD